LNFILLASVIQRREIVSDGSDSVLLTLSFWLMFIAANRHYALDALRLRWSRFQKSHNLADLRAPIKSEMIFALPVRLLQLQIALIYTMTFFQKLPGVEWQNGLALHYVFQQQAFGLFTSNMIMTHIPTDILVLGTHFTLVIEGSFLILVFLPFFQPWLRLFALSMGMMLHIGIALTLSIANFSLAMMLSYLSFLCIPELDVWRARFRKKHPVLYIQQPPSAQDIRWSLLALTRPDILAISDTAPRKSIIDLMTQLTPALPLSWLWRLLIKFPISKSALFWLLRHHPVNTEVQPAVSAHPKNVVKYSRYARTLFLIPLMLLLIYWSVVQIHQDDDDPLPSLLANPVAETLFDYTQLANGWAMFAPRPGLVDIWAEVVGDFSDNSRRNLLLETAYPTTDNVYWWAGPYARWKLYVRQMWFDQDDTVLSVWADYYCHRYNTSQATARLQTIEITLIARWTYQPGRAEPFTPMHDSFTYSCIQED
ncbi:MAG: hypothetical protein ACPG7F_19285, partial [Aggregatilineales bacterium]